MDKINFPIISYEYLTICRLPHDFLSYLLASIESIFHLRVSIKGCSLRFTSKLSYKLIYFTYFFFLSFQISEISEIPPDNIDIAKVQGSFPCIDVSVLGIHSDLEWNPSTKQLDVWPLNILDDGHVIFYR